MRKIIIKSLAIVLILNSSFGSFIGKYVHDLLNKDYILEFKSNEYIYVEENKIFDTITYSYGNIKDVLKGDIESEDIKNLLYNSKNLNDVEKDCIWNQELIDMVVPYYRDTYFETVTLVRHTNLKIESFTFKERENLNGYYNGDNVIHLKNYGSNFIENVKKTLGHEYVHLLQVSSVFQFISESSAEIMSHEFFLNSTDMSEVFSYSKACKYLKILMEIVGPEVILENNFSLYSTSLQNAVRNYFSDEEYNEFIDIMNLNPFNDAFELENSGYARLEELLKVLYNNKFDKDISEDVMINAILNDDNYNRVYFNKSLSSFGDYVVVNKTFSVEDAINDGHVKVKLRNNVTKEEYDSYDGSKSWSFISKENGKVYFESIRPYDQAIATLPSEILESVETGEWYTIFTIEKDVDALLYSKLKDLKDVEFIYELEDGYVLDDERKVIYNSNENEKVYVLSLSEKFDSNKKLP